MKVLVCGGRDYQDKMRVFAELNMLRPTHVIHGACPTGADSFAREYCSDESQGVIEEAYPAKWHKHGPAAGPIRNRQMLFEGKPDVVLAFPGGRGTADMVARARKVGVRVIEVTAQVERAAAYHGDIDGDFNYW